MAKEEKKEEAAEEKEEEKSEDVSGLKKALEAERKARKEAEKKIKAERDEKERMEREALEKNKEFETLYKQSQEKLQSLNKQIIERDVTSALSKVAGQLTKSADRMGDIVTLYKGLAKHTDDGVVFEHGGIPLTPEQLAEKIKAERPYLVDGNQSSGGDATGNEKAGGQINARTQAEIDKMSPADRMQFFLDGGTVKT